MTESKLVVVQGSKRGRERQREGVPRGMRKLGGFVYVHCPDCGHSFTGACTGQNLSNGTL